MTNDRSFPNVLLTVPSIKLKLNKIESEMIPKMSERFGPKFYVFTTFADQVVLDLFLVLSEDLNMEIYKEDGKRSKC